MAGAILEYLHPVRLTPQDSKLQWVFMRALEAVGGMAEVVMELRRYLELRSVRPEEQALRRLAEEQLRVWDLSATRPTN